MFHCKDGTHLSYNGRYGGLGCSGTFTDLNPGFNRKFKTL